MAFLSLSKQLTAPNFASVMLILLFISFAEALEDNPFQSSHMREKRRLLIPVPYCPRLTMICPTKQQYLIINSCWIPGGFFGKCEIQGSVLDIALKNCDIGPMEQCKDKWKNKPNKCSVPVPGLKQILDRVFHHACTLHDLCYLSLNADRSDCDKWFYHNLKQICLTKRPWYRRLACRITAYKMYKAVALVGSSHFDDAQDWADENCSTNLKIPGTTKRSIPEGSRSGIHEESV